MSKKIPLVSVIIPMYNSAKFIPQTLESLLNQTLKNFEVVVVDDCSTDNSVEVVENFATKFNTGGGINVIKLRRNTGTPGLPRNVGIKFARGRYITFLDSDDLLTSTALEELTTLAEEYRAEIVHNNSWFVLWDNQRKVEDDPAMTDMTELLNPENFTHKTDVRTPIDDTIRFETESLAERVRRWSIWDYHWGAPSLFCRRDFLVTNRIFFPDIRVYEDMTFFFECLFKAKRFLRVPNVTYIVRPRRGSVTRDENHLQPEKIIKNCLTVTQSAVKEFKRIMNSLDFFRANKNYEDIVLDFFLNGFNWVSSVNLPPIYAKIPMHKMYELIKKEFNADNAALAAYLFNTVNVHRIRFKELELENRVLKKVQTM